MHLDIDVLALLLADGHYAAPSGAVLISVIEVERFPDRLRQLAGHGARGERLRALREGYLLSLGELIDRLIEDDQREDVRLLERRCAGQHDLRLLQRASDVHVRGHALNDALRPQIERRIQFVEPFEPHRAVTKNLELPPLEIVGPANGVHGTHETDLVPGDLAHPQVAPDRQVQRPETDGSGVCRLRLDDGRWGQQVDVHLKRTKALGLAALPASGDFRYPPSSRGVLISPDLIEV